MDYESVTGRETLTTVDRVNSHMVPEDGTLTCKRPGTCKYHWNQYPGV